MKKILLITSLLVGSAFAQVNGKIEVPYIDYKLKDGKNKEVVEANCFMCHSFGYMENQGAQSRDFWYKKVMKMKHAFKAPIPDEDVNKIADYMFANYGNGKLK